MPIYKKPEEKAVETVTIRLTVDERRMLDHLSSVDNVTLTDFIRGFIARRATELGITELPPKAPRRRPGRPKKKRPPAMVEFPDAVPDAEKAERAAVSGETATSEPIPEADAVPAYSPNVAFGAESGARTNESADPPKPIAATAEKQSADFPLFNSALPAEAVEPVAQGGISWEAADAAGPASFGDLVVRFRETFAHRADGTKRELEETISFLCQKTDRPAILPPAVLLDTLTPETLADVRERIRISPVRLAKKNLYLTYLRMMLHFGVKEPGFTLRINPSRELPPFSIVESDERRRFFTGVGE